MGINWGIALGSAAKTGVDTWERLNEEERKQEAEKRAKAQFEEWQRATQEAADIRQAGKDTYGRVGTQDYSSDIGANAGVGQQQASALNVNSGDADFDRAAAESAVGAMRQNAASQGQALPEQTEMKGQTYTREMADKDYLRKVAAINPEKALDVESKQMGVKNTRIDLGRKEKEEELARWHGDMVDLAIKDGPMKAAERMRDEYNNGSAHKDGITAEIVPSGKPGEYSLVRTNDKTGKVVDSTPITHETVMDGIEGMAYQKWKAIGGNFAKGKELDYKGIEANAAKTKADASAALVPSEIRKNTSAAGYYDANAEYLKNGGRGSSNSAANQEKALDMKAQALVAGQPGRFKDVEQAKAWLVNSSAKGVDVDKSWKDIEKELVKLGTPDNQIVQRKEAYFAREGFAPSAAIAAARSGINPATKKPFTDAEKSEFFRRYPNSDVEFGAPSTTKPTAALPAANSSTPAESEKKYIRSKSPRGGYSYTESPRGLTKKQYEEIDNKQ